MAEILNKLNINNGYRMISTSNTDPVYINTGIHSLDTYFHLCNFKSSLIEFGCPMGHLNRIFPALFLKSFNKNSLWISQITEAKFYTRFFKNLGVDERKLYLINENKCLNSIKTVVMDSAFSVIVIDTSEFLSKSDLSYLFTYCRKNKSIILILRPYYLSNLNGNPFTKFRFNTFFSLKKNVFTFKSIKGGPKKHLDIKLNEIFK